MSDIKIFVSHRIDKESIRINNPLYYDVRCGAVYDDKESDIAGDDTGDNISEKRNTYCELTVQYWAWKNIEADYYGLCHYRRYISFSENRYNEDEYGNIIYKYLNEKVIDEMGLDEKNMREQIEQYDFILSAPYKVSSVRKQYAGVSFLNEKDLDIALEILIELYPHFKDVAIKYINGNNFYPCNLFVMKRNVFNEYSKWLFTILEELEKKIDLKNYSVEMIRSVGHIAERLLGIYYLYLKAQNKYKLGIFQRFIIENPEKKEKLRPAFDIENIPIVMACSDYYALYAGITLESIVNTISSKKYYDIIILNTSVSKNNQELLQRIVKKYNNIKLRFYNISHDIEHYKFIANNHIAVETFYRLAVQKIFCNYNKVIWVDSDIIVKNDLAELYDIDIGNNLIAATLDADWLSQYNNNLNHELKKYCADVLKLNNPFSYFQAGILVFNVYEFNSTFSENELLESAGKQAYMYCDQDVLNSKCQDRVHFLDMNWNVMTSCNGQRVKTIQLLAPYSICDQYMKAREDPYIIHYAGYNKPWNDPSEDFGYEFWTIARKSEIYESLLYRLSVVASTNIIMQKKSRKLVKDTILHLFPEGTKRRVFLKRVYYKFRGWPIQ